MTPYDALQKLVMTIDSHCYYWYEGLHNSIKYVTELGC